MPYKDKERKRVQQAAYYASHREKLKQWQRQYSADHKEARSAYYKTWALTHRDARKDKDRLNHARWRQSIRESLWALLGRECVRCGFSDVRALQIDHIDGGGNQERKASRSLDEYYQKIIACGGKGYQVLCANCNQIKRHEKREFSGC